MTSSSKDSANKSKVPSKPGRNPSPEWRAWRSYFETTAKLQDTIEHVLRREADLHLADYNVLLILHEAPEHRLRIGQVADRMAFSKSRMSYQVRSLEKRGLITRETVEADARGVCIHLTDKGREVFRKAGRIHADQVRELVLDEMTEREAEVLETFFTRVAKRLED